MSADISYWTGSTELIPFTVTKGGAALDVSGASNPEIVFVGEGRGFGLAFAFDADLGNGTGTDGKIVVAPTAASFPAASGGRYEAQAQFTLGGKEVVSDIVQVRVRERLQKTA